MKMYQRKILYLGGFAVGSHEVLPLARDEYPLTVLGTTNAVNFVYFVNVTD